MNRPDLARAIHRVSHLTGTFTLRSGAVSSEYFDKYRFEADPARWKFLTGDMATIKEIANGTFLLPAEVGVHSERGVVFDRQGRLRGSYHLLQPDRVKLLEKLIREVLDEPADAAPGEGSRP